MALLAIEATIKLHRMVLANFNLPSVKANPNKIKETNTTSFELQKKLQEMMKKVNDEQLIIIEQIMNTIKQNDNQICNAHFIDGPGGSGKTFLYHCLIHCALF